MTRPALALALVMAAIAPAFAQVKSAEVKLGLGAPLSGPEAIFGTQMRIGVEQAVADTNASGGLAGHQIDLIIGDDGDKAQQGVEVAKRFVSAKVPFVIGHFSSAVTLAASAVYGDAGILDITPSAIAPAVTDRGFPLMVRTCGREDAQVAVAAAYLASHAIAKVAIVHDKTTFGKALGDAMRKALASRGIKESLYGSVDAGARDISALVGRLKASGAQVVFWSGGAADAGALARQLHEANAHIMLMGGAGMASDEFVSLAGSGADGSLIVFPEDPRQRKTTADLRARFKARGVDPDAIAFYAYAAVQVLRQASDASQSVDAKVVAATIHSGMTFKTILGALTFDQKGDPSLADYTVYVWHKNHSGHMAYDDLADG